MAANQPCLYCDGDCEFGFGYCHCGCGQKTKITWHNAYKYRGMHVPKGQPYKFLYNHHTKLARKFDEDTFVDLHEKLRLYREENICPWCSDEREECEVGTGYCHCGCGKKANPQPHQLSRGLIGGLPWKYLVGHHSRRLSSEQVAQVRYLYATQKVTQKELAQRFGISQATISSLLRFKTFKEAGILSPVEAEHQPNTKQAHE